MSSVRFIKDRHGYINFQGGTDIPIEILGHFLMTDNHCSKNSWQDWAKEAKSLRDDQFPHTVGSNITFLEIDQNEIISMYNDLDHNELEEKAPHLKISVDQFVELLDEWYERVCKQQPQEVLLKYENNTYTLEIIQQ